MNVAPAPHEEPQPLSVVPHVFCGAALLLRGSVIAEKQRRCEAIVLRGHVSQALARSSCLQGHWCSRLCARCLHPPAPLSWSPDSSAASLQWPRSLFLKLNFGTECDTAALMETVLTAFDCVHCRRQDFPCFHAYAITIHGCIVVW